MRCKIIDVPVQEGTDRHGCALGPAALRAAGLVTALRELGHEVNDLGAVALAEGVTGSHANPAIKHLAEVSAWTIAAREAAYHASADGFPIFLGGDHSMSGGTVSGLSLRAAEAGRPLFVLWLDAHSDFHTLETTVSGNLHGTPLAYICGQDGFSGGFPPNAAPVDPRHVCALGLRSVDAAERSAIARAGVTAYDMSMVDRRGIAPLLEEFLNRVKAANGLLHVSLDVDFLDPAIAPAVGTTVPGGATYREAHLTMELLHESGLASSLDIVELNPTLDQEGRTAALMVDLAASLMGRSILGTSNQAA